jgi:CRP-like cAMP-binding protein
VALNTKQVIYQPDKPIDYVYFPQMGVLSLLATMKDGAQVEVATVGHEGMVGVGVLLDALHVHLKVICQVPGASVRIKASAFRKEMQRSAALHRLMHRYTEALMIQFTQGVACNRLHTVEQRAARWLLMTRDRVESDTFPLTQEFLGQMLGVRRASVTVVAGLLQKAGLIQYARGVVRVMDRKGLEKQACECYEVIRSEVERLTNGQ